MGESIDCREAAARLDDFLKQELTAEVAAQMQAHLEKCRPCFAQARFEQRFLAMLEQQAGRCGCPETLRARIAILLRAEMGRG
jgi:anti-sigma factor (TIGR02949 family)